jgi:hypothetical protein
MDARFQGVDARFQNLEGQMETRFQSLENRMDDRFQGVEVRIQSLENLIRQLMHQVSLEGSLRERIAALEARLPQH